MPPSNLLHHGNAQMDYATFYRTIDCVLSRDYGLLDVPRTFTQHVVETRYMPPGLAYLRPTYANAATCAFLVANEWQRGLDTRAG